MAGTTLAIGTGYMYAFKFCLRVIQRLANGYCIMKVFFVSYGANTAKHGQVLVKIVDGLPVVHLCKYTGGSSSSLRDGIETRMTRMIETRMTRIKTDVH